MIGQSGGPTAVINASLAGAIKASLDSKEIEKVLGIIYGIDGAIRDDVIDLTRRFSNDQKELELLKYTPSSFLGSCRKKLKLPCEFDETYKRIFDTFKKHDVSYFIYIGGNDSMDTVNKLSNYAKSVNSGIKIIGVPKTIDNDLAMTDHSPGFGSAAKYIATSMREIIKDSQVYGQDTLTIVEIMGRNAGWLTSSAALAREENEQAPHLIYLPEVIFSVEKFLKDVERINKKYKNVIVAVSEGIKDKDDKYICEYQVNTGKQSDSFGHKQLTGTAQVLSQIVSSETNKYKIRAIELSLLQRCAAHLTSKVDLEESYMLGYQGVKAAVNGLTDVMMCMNRLCNNPYKIEISPHPIDEIANLERKVPREWINSDCNDVHYTLNEYILPLIQGEVPVKFDNGLPVHLKR